MSGPSCTSQDEFTTPTAFDDNGWWWKTRYIRRLNFARRLAAVRFHRWDASPNLPNGWLCKRRGSLSEILIPPGNLYLRLQGALSEMLPLKSWMTWEQAVAAQLKREIRPTADRRGLEFPRLPGTSLEEILRAGQSESEKLQATFLAAAGLRNLHQVTLSAFGTSDWPLSHGDATCRNVILDQETSTAQWIDFDMRHRSHLSPAIRHADDLRALIWSSAARLEASTYHACIAAACAGYGDRDTSREMGRLIDKRVCPTVFQLGQAEISAADFAKLRHAIRKHM